MPEVVLELVSIFDKYTTVMKEANKLHNLMKIRIAQLQEQFIPIENPGKGDNNEVHVAEKVNTEHENNKKRNVQCLQQQTDNNAQQFNGSINNHQLDLSNAEFNVEHNIEYDVQHLVPSNANHLAINNFQPLAANNVQYSLQQPNVNPLVNHVRHIGCSNVQPFASNNTNFHPLNNSNLQPFARNDFQHIVNNVQSEYNPNIQMKNFEISNEEVVNFLHYL